MTSKPNILLIDNYDSFTYNLVQSFLAQGADVDVYRNDEVTVDETHAKPYTHLVVSPGPGHPSDAGVSLAMIAAYAGKLPILGVCLGHQCIVQNFGGEIVRAERLMHGKTSMVSHDRMGIYERIPQPVVVGRYHSLCASVDSMPAELEITGQTERGEIMSIRHRRLPIEGVQFHPESVLTPDGDEMMKNFMESKA